MWWESRDLVYHPPFAGDALSACRLHHKIRQIPPILRHLYLYKVSLKLEQRRECIPLGWISPAFHSY
jgi:hypothetical protein